MPPRPFSRSDGRTQARLGPLEASSLPGVFPATWEAGRPPPYLWPLMGRPKFHWGKFLAQEGVHGLSGKPPKLF